MNSIFYNRKGSAKYLSIWWFFVLAMIGAGIVISVSSFSTGDVSTKSLETESLTDRIIDCLIDGGYLNEDVLNKDFDFFSSCNINSNIISSSGDYYIEFGVYKWGDCNFILLRKI